jgi:DNA invertase Pin-like site-specific DNA recombinase
VLVIDEDQGHSGASAADRVGFQRLVSEVGLNHVGLVLGIEISRLASCNSDWYHLMDLCALSHTLIADVDGVYDPRGYNDRLLLGLKGTMSEAELHILRQRMDAGRWAKARRGELRIALPMGYVRRPSGEVIKDPDEQVQGVIETIFASFDRCRTINGVVRYLRVHGLQLPVRERCGPERGSLRWSRPSARTLRKLFANPIYAGAYVYGRREREHQGRVRELSQFNRPCLRSAGRCV